jgi:carbon monoxide dehydrogenase subunit G
MEKYESKQHQIRRPAEQVYAVMSDFRNFSPLLGDKVENWQAEENRCSFTVKGIPMRLEIVDKVPGNVIKFTGEDGSPFDFTFWIQMKEVAPCDTRFRLVLHANLNMMVKMMVGSKLRDGIEQVAKTMADAFNGIMPEGFDPNAFGDLGFGGDVGAKQAAATHLDDFEYLMPDPDKPVS